MQALFVRHGQAVDPYLAGSDRDRWLTMEGRVTVERVGAALKDAGHVPERIFSSPLVRAVQTAELLAGATGYAGEIRVWPPLAGGTTALALGALEEAPDAKRVMLVGHEPLIRAMASQATGTSIAGFRTGMVCVADIDRENLQGILDPSDLAWIDAAELLRRLQS